MVENPSHAITLSSKGIGLRRPLRFSSRAVPKFIRRHWIATAVAWSS